jgi:hypothetical protein
MTDTDKILEIQKTIYRMRESLGRYGDCESKRAKMSVLRVIEGVILND